MPPMTKLVDLRLAGHLTAGQFTTSATARGSIFGFKVDRCRCSEAIRREIRSLSCSKGEGHYFFFCTLLGVVDWNTEEADIRFSMYWPSTWFSERSFRFSSFTLSTRCDRSSSVFCNSST